jgi:hypothetical protein
MDASTPAANGYCTAHSSNATTAQTRPHTQPSAATSCHAKSCSCCIKLPARTEAYPRWLRAAGEPPPPPCRTAWPASPCTSKTSTTTRCGRTTSRCPQGASTTSGPTTPQTPTPRHRHPYRRRQPPHLVRPAVPAASHHCRPQALRQRSRVQDGVLPCTLDLHLPACRPFLQLLGSTAGPGPDLPSFTTS